MRSRRLRQAWVIVGVLVVIIALGGFVLGRLSIAPVPTVTPRVTIEVTSTARNNDHMRVQGVLRNEGQLPVAIEPALVLLFEDDQGIQYRLGATEGFALYADEATPFDIRLPVPPGRRVRLVSPGEVFTIIGAEWQ